MLAKELKRIESASRRMENFSTFTSEDGIETFKCLICSSTFGSQKSVKTHVTKKHTGKAESGKMKDTVIDDEHADTMEDELDFERSNVVKSTQVNPTAERLVTTADIFREYGDDEVEPTLEEETSNGSALKIPDDTYDDLMRKAPSDDSSNATEANDDAKVKIESL